MVSTVCSSCGSRGQVVLPQDAAESDMIILQPRPLKWSCQVHKRFPGLFKDYVKTLLLCCHRRQVAAPLKVRGHQDHLDGHSPVHGPCHSLSVLAYPFSLSQTWRTLQASGRDTGRDNLDLHMASLPSELLISIISKCAPHVLDIEDAE